MTLTHRLVKRVAPTLGALLLQACALVDTPRDAGASESAQASRAALPTAEPKLFFPAGGMPLPATPGSLAEYTSTWVVFEAGVPGQLLQTLGPTLTWTTIAGSDEGTFVAPPVVDSGAWTNVNFGTFTTFNNSGSAATPSVFLSDFRSGGADTARCSFLARPLNTDGGVGTGGPYTLTASIRPLQYPGNNSGAGIAVSDGTKVIVWQLVYNTGGVAMQIVDRTSATTISGNAYSFAWNIGQNARFWLRIQNDGVNRFYTYSSDGLNFLPTAQMADAGTLIACNGTGAYCYQAAATFIANAESLGGICINPESSVGSGLTLESLSFTSP